MLTCVHYMETRHALFLAIMVGSISTETTTYVILGITTAQNVYKCISIIRKAKKNEDGKLVFQRTYEILP